MRNFCMRNNHAVYYSCSSSWPKVMNTLVVNEKIVGSKIVGNIKLCGFPAILFKRYDHILFRSQGLMAFIYKET